MTRYEEPSITPYPDGPLIVRGAVRIVTPADRARGSARRTIALCRCGVSMIKPYCDGSHKLVGFRTSDEPVAGGEE
jgi:CDGSH-type Zn-finger protein